MTGERHSVSDFQAMMATHADWVVSDGRKGKRADFSGFVFAGDPADPATQIKGGPYYFCDIVARQSRITGQDFCFHKSDFAGAIIEESAFDGSDLTSADFRHIHILKQTSFLDCRLHGTKFTLTPDLMTCLFPHNGPGSPLDADLYTAAGRRIEGDFVFDESGHLTFSRGTTLDKFLNLVHDVDFSEIEWIMQEAAQKREE